MVSGRIADIATHQSELLIPDQLLFVDVIGAVIYDIVIAAVGFAEIHNLTEGIRIKVRLPVLLVYKLVNRGSENRLQKIGLRVITLCDRRHIRRQALGDLIKFIEGPAGAISDNR